MDGRRAQRINVALVTRKRRELFDMMLIEVAAGRWAELEPNGYTLLTIRWQAVRKFPDSMRSGAYANWDPTYHENVFVKLLHNAVLVRRSIPWVTARDSEANLAKALAVVRDPVAALGLAPVPVLCWRLVWGDGTPELLNFADAEEAAPPSTELIAEGHAARHALDDGAIRLDAALNVRDCRFCHASAIPGRDVVFHPYKIEIVERIPKGNHG